MHYQDYDNSYLSKQNYQGTVVDLQFPYDHKFKTTEVFKDIRLSDTNVDSEYVMEDFIDSKYSTEDGTALQLLMDKEIAGAGSRRSGGQTRQKVNNILLAEPSKPIFLNWDNVQVIASSYADELIGKLFLELGPSTFMNKVRLIKMTEFVRIIIDRAILQRVMQYRPQ